VSPSPLSSLSPRIASLAVVALAAITIVSVAAGGAQAAVSAPPVPYNDQFASGTVTLCDESLHAVTSGSTNTRPFVWRAVSSGPAPAAFNIQNRRAYLMYFQPRQGVAPNLWTGYLMTAASAYDSTDHAIAQATKLDLSIGDFVKEVPSQWGGFVQLRMYFSAPGAGESSQYAATDIFVSGDSWVVAGNKGTAPCDVGNAISPEVAIPNYSASVAAVQSQEAQATASSIGAGTGPSKSAAGAAARGSTQSTSTSPTSSPTLGSPTPSPSGSGSAPSPDSTFTTNTDQDPSAASLGRPGQQVNSTTGAMPLLLGLLVATGGAVGAVLFVRRRRAAGKQGQGKHSGFSADADSPYVH
jgi:hypothetical protein